MNDRRVDDATGERKRFSSRILTPWCRKSPRISGVLPLLYLHELSSGDFVPALEQFLGSTAGLSPATESRLTRQRQDDHAAFQERDLSDRDFVYVGADGVHPKVRLGQAHSCVLVLLAVRLDGTKELIALAEGLRESTESWAGLLRDCRRGMRDPELAVGDGAMGLLKVLAEVFPAAIKVTDEEAGTPPATGSPVPLMPTYSPSPGAPDAGPSTSAPLSHLSPRPPCHLHLHHRHRPPRPAAERAEADGRSAAAAAPRAAGVLPPRRRGPVDSRGSSRGREGARPRGRTVSLAVKRPCRGTRVGHTECSQAGRKYRLERLVSGVRRPASPMTAAVRGNGSRECT